MSSPSPAALRKDLVIQEQVLRGRPYGVVKDPVTRRYFRLPAASLRLARRFDGARTAAELAEDASGDDDEVEADEVEALAAQLGRLALLDEGLAPEEIARRQPAPPGSQRSALQLRWPLLDPDRALDRLLPVFRPLLSWPFVAAVAALLSAAVALVALDGPAHAAALSAATRGAGLGWLYVATVLTTSLHELAHALTCKRFGGEVRQVGLMLYYLMPCAYTDVSDAYLLPRTSQRIWVTLAGSISDLLVWSAAAVALALAEPGPTGEKILGALLLTTGLRSVAFNMNPLVRLDGYYLLVDLLEMPNLRPRAFRVIRFRLARLLGREAQEPGESGRERSLLELYGWLSLCYVAVLIPVAGLLLDRWLVATAGPIGRAAWGALGALLLVTWLARRRRRVARRRAEAS